MSGTFYSVAPLPDTNSRQVAQTIRVPSTALLTIDSEDRYTNYLDARVGAISPYNFNIAKNESLMPGFMTRIGVSEVVFPWVVPNINKKTDSIQYTYSIGGGAAVLGVVTLLQGFYRPQEIATAMTAEFAGIAGLGFAMSYGDDVISNGQPCFFYSVSAGNTFAFRPMAYNSAAQVGPPAIPAYPYPSITKQLFDLLGFTTYNTSLRLSAEGTYTYCQAIRYVDIVCNQLTNSQAQKDQTSQTVARDMLCRIYVGGAPGVSSTTFAGDVASATVPATFCPPGCAPTTIYRNFTEAKQIQWIPNQNIPGFLQFTVYDDAGAPLDESLEIGIPGAVGTYSDWSMTLLVSEV
jgi:hypothetical protein